MGSFWGEFALYLGPLCLVCAALLIGFDRGASRERRLFHHLSDHPEDRAFRSASSAWLEWVNAAFPPGVAATTRLTRQDAVNEFDIRMLSRLAYQGLQRLAVAAPLFGVMISTWKFVSYKVPATASPTLGEILQTAAGPLFVGVGTGATLALACQLALLLANRSLARARFSALRWFDAHVWQGINPLGHSSVMQAIEAMRRFSATLDEASQRHHMAVQTLDVATDRLGRAAQDFADNAGRMNKDLDAMARQISSGVGELIVSCHAIKPLADQVPDLLGKLAQVGQGVGLFDEAIRTRFVPASTSLGRAAKDVETWTAKLRIQQEQSAEASGLLRAASSALDTASGKINISINLLNERLQQLGQSVGHLGQIVQRIDVASQGLQDFEEKAIRPVRRSFAGLDAILQQLNGTSADFRKLLAMQPQLVPLLQALERAIQVAGEVNKLPAQVRSALDSMQQDLAAAAKGLGQEAGRAVKASLDQQTLVIGQVQQAIDQMPLQLARALEQLRSQLERLSQNMIIEQADGLETTLQQILIKMDGRKGRAKKS
jgi:hypothetical protein